MGDLQLRTPSAAAPILLDPETEFLGTRIWGKEAGPGFLPTRVPILTRTLYDSRALSLI